MAFEEEIQRAISVYVFTVQAENPKVADMPDDKMRQRIKVALSTRGPPETETRKAFQIVEDLFDAEYTRTRNAVT